MYLLTKKRDTSAKKHIATYIYFLPFCDFKSINKFFISLRPYVTFQVYQYLTPF